MTNEQCIRSLSRKDLASILIEESTREDWDYDYEEEPFLRGCKTIFRTSDGVEFDEYSFDDAVEHECWWLQQEAECWLLQQEAVACGEEKLD